MSRREMEREGFTVPLLIGGATTSRVTRPSKIAPHYSGPVVYVPDASRSVSVVQSLISQDTRAKYVAEVTADYEEGARAACREERSGLGGARRGAFGTGVCQATARRFNEQAARLKTPSSWPSRPIYRSRRAASAKPRGYPTSFHSA